MFICVFLDLLFSKAVFWSWIFYGMWQGVAAFYVSFFAMEGATSSGKVASTVSIDGQLVYFGIVFLVNLKILWSSNNYSLYTFIFTIGSVLTFILAFWVVNLFDFYAAQDIY